VTPEAERLLETLCAQTVTTGEALSFLGTDGRAISAEKPSRDDE